ncbi:Fic family protein [Thioalkalivibrio sp. HK1]|uniref:Fic family protein n=1 Tax=Thioalkalivibrio sp. HK1 TaxID=1469245 RepID=UPI0004714496|nr:Fic family protein [Thioalkalivibrio sp. HK1]
MEYQRQTGVFVENTLGGERIAAFVPCALPPDPPLDLGSLLHLLERAASAVGRLDSMSERLPSGKAPLRPTYRDKEALLSSQIEGTQSTLDDIFLFDKDKDRSESDDLQEVLNLSDAIEHGLKRIREDDFPLCLRLLREMHEILLRSGRGAAKLPGEFRTSQNWIGGTRPGNATFVPPPPDRLDECLGDFERFLHSEDPRITPLIKAGLAHLQFEIIHPFLDGNGRLGRLLITLILCEAGMLKEPILYLSRFFKSHLDVYYRLLDETRRTGAWEVWMEFFLTGVAQTAEQASKAASDIIATFEEDRKAIRDRLGRSAPSALNVHEQMQIRAITTAALVSNELNISYPTAQSALENLVKVGIVHKTEGKRRGQHYVYSKYYALLSE